MHAYRAAWLVMLLAASSSCADACGACAMAVMHDPGPPPTCVIDDDVEVTLTCDHTAGTGGGDIGHLDPATFRADAAFLDDNPRLTRAVDIARCADVCFHWIAEQ
jgi:hypothetical protein